MAGFSSGDRFGPRSIGGFVALGLVMGLTVPVAAQPSDRASILIYDASGSMWGQLDGGSTKVEVARKVIGDFFASRDHSVPLGVVAYGHNRRGDCADIETIADVGVRDPVDLSARLNRLNPRGMTPITESLSLAASMIPRTAELADIILVTDGLETCDADPCALAERLARDGIAIRAHVVGFGLSAEEAAAMSCVTNATGGLLLRPQTGQELANALNQIARVEPGPPSAPIASFDIGDKAEAGFNYTIQWKGQAGFTDLMGFVPRGESRAQASGSFGPIGGTSKVPSNPVTRVAPSVPGIYDLALISASTGEEIARQAVEVVSASNGFDPVGSVEPGVRFQVSWRGPNQVGQRIVMARADAPPDDYSQSWGYPYSNRSSQVMNLRAPAESGMYELRYLSADRKEIMFFRPFGVGVPFEDADLVSSAALEKQAAVATQAVPGQDAMPMVPARFYIAESYPQVPRTWKATPLNSDTSSQPWVSSSDVVIGEGAFEPGSYRVTATGSDGALFSAEVEIYPGRDNRFAIPPAEGSNDEASAAMLSGVWTVVGVPPYQVQMGADPLLSLDIELTSGDGPIVGGWIALERLAGPQAAGREGRLASASIEGDVVRMSFSVGSPIDEPMLLYLRPYGAGYAGALSSGAMGISVVMWPDDQELPSLADMRAAVHGPMPNDFVDMTGSSR